jgi:hypothetical protein
MRKEYHFRNGEIGKYARRYSEGTNVVLLDADVAAAFPDSKSVNEALRALLRIGVKLAVSSRHRHALRKIPLLLGRSL